jgi:hypothetical protein
MGVEAQILLVVRLGPRGTLAPVSFFDDFPVPPPPPERPRPERKPWMGPPPGWVGGWVPWRIVLTRTADAYAVIGDVEAFPSGVQFSLLSRFRPGTFDPHPGPGRPMLRPGFPGGPLFGVAFGDGRKAMLGRTFPSPDEPDPSGPVLISRGGGGGGEEWRMGMWLWPLPPSGPLKFVTSWAEREQAESSITVDAGELVAGANAAEQLWVVDEDALTSGYSGFSGAAMIGTMIRKPEEPPPTQPTP